ncbi:hypothetical protein QWY31_10500 [Cytophagales bacterium LB-30]|uniref:DUF1735 domain-containing protein n=1 Tax=Shiella aurantiaca TaxID=3058365 RepID=A0ABT8F6E4_9BACT|nr:hypothetical protein [Shiella aurantiaca]MDN4165934.1 hypothetical protein [Shiella aurantiaca]
MRKLSLYILQVGLVASIFACSESETLIDQIEGSPNVAGFVDRSINISGIADGTEYTNQVPLWITGPSTDGLSGDYSLTIEVDPSSTAIEGTHFRIDNKSATLSAGKNLTDLFTIVMLTEGIETPLETAPVLKLMVSAVSGSGNVVASGAPLTVNMLYLCPSDLAAAYQVTIVRNDGNVYSYSDVIESTGPGQYRGVSVGHWAPGSIGGTPGFDFVDVCNVITVPEQNLVNLYSNLVYQGGDSYVDPVTGNLHIEYYVSFAAGDRKYVADYVKL